MHVIAALRRVFAAMRADARRVGSSSGGTISFARFSHHWRAHGLALVHLPPLVGDGWCGSPGGPRNRAAVADADRNSRPNNERRWKRRRRP